MMDISNRNSINLCNKCVSVIGAERSGLSATELLLDIGAKVLLSDKNPEISDNTKIDNLRNRGVVTEFGFHSKNIYESDLMVVSPGVPQDADVIITAKRQKIPVISEVELASWFTKMPILAVTGSNGKTTTATIIAEMFQESNYIPYLAGNIGIPFSLIVNKYMGNDPENGILILEISSFQMEHIRHFKPNVAVLLNITPDHLDRYATMEEYTQAKMRIIENMTPDDTVVFNGDDEFLTKSVNRTTNWVPFSFQNITDTPFKVNATKIYNSHNEIVVYLKDISLPGRHNIENFLAAATACNIFNISLDKIRNVMTTFSGVPHRIERIRTINGVDYYNDSKATNVDSVKVALDSFSQPIILILGGRDKGADFKELLPHLAPYVKTILVMGEASRHIINALGDKINCVQADSIKTAVKTAYKETQPGDVVLLSPGCASFDMFENFEHRGDVFKKAVNQL